MTRIQAACAALLLLLSTLVTAMAAGGDSAAPAKAERRIALVLGNSAYQNVPALPNPVVDAKAIAAELEKLNFEVISGYDLTKLETQETIARFAKDVRGADIALFYYAGHGMQVDGNNYLLPVDASLEDETSLDFETVQINFILRQMSRETGLRLVFLDACRDNPLAKAFGENSGASGVSSGLAEIQIEKSGKGTLVAFATSPNDVAYDGAGKHSPFTTALLAHLGEPDVPLTSAMTRVTSDVVKATDGLQRPWVNLSLTEDVILNPAKPAEPPQQTVASNSGDQSSTSRAAGVGASNPAGDQAALDRLRAEIPGLVTKGPITFDMPVQFGEPEIDGKSISQLIEGKPLYAPIEGLDKAIWSNHCTNCHQWTKDRLCEQAKNYDKVDISIMRLEHPLGTRFKVALANWAHNGCR
jgi:uncharacterized caspase-like protein